MAETIEVLDENVPAFMLFVDCATQWRWGPTGPVGLDYAAVDTVMNWRRVERRERAALFADLRIMESAALETMRSKP